MTDTTISKSSRDEDLLAALDAAEESGPGQDWQPEPRETVVGTVLRFEHPRTKAENRVLPVVVLEIDGDDGPEELRVAVKHKVLRDELLKAKPEIGDRLAVRFLGQPEGKSYFVYVVSVKHEGARDESRRFTLEPLDDDGLTSAALASSNEERPVWG